MKRRILQNLGTKTLALYLILSGLSRVIGLAFQGMALFLGILAVAAGALLFMGR